MYINVRKPTTINELILKALDVEKSIPFRSIAFDCT
jgi:hypothetical protein